MKHWTNIVREVFPNAHIADCVLQMPWRADGGWPLQLPTIEQCDFDNPAFKLFISLNDWLTPGKQYHLELERIYEYYSAVYAPMDQIVVLVEHVGVAENWPRDRFRIVEFSTFEYETWCAYSAAEDVLRDAFAPQHKTFEYNYVCPQRIYKPHRAALQDSLNSRIGNISLQTKGIELAYPNLSVAEYDANYDNLTNLLAMKKNYNTALFTIISETIYTDPYPVITEKLFNAVVAGHPFLVCASSGYLEAVKSRGLETWDYIFDEQYDELDNIVRMKDMIMANYGFTLERLTPAQLEEIHLQCLTRINSNIDYFFSGYGDHLIGKLRNDLLSLWRGY